MKTTDDEMKRRIEQIIDMAFAGSQRSLAEAVRMSPALVSRVVSGLRPASNKLVQALTQLPQINSKWLLTGKGKPLQTQPQVLTDLGSIVPMAKRLLSGRMLESEDILSSRFIAVPRAYYAADVYAIAVHQVIDAGQFRDDRLTSQFLTRMDILVIDTTPEKCQAFDRLGNHQLRVIRNSDGSVALLDIESDRTTKPVPRSKDASGPSDEFDQQFCRPPRAIRFDDTGPPIAQKRQGVVVGVVTLLMREF